MLLPLRGVATPGHGEGEGSAGDKFRVSGTQETVEGAGANEVSGVLRNPYHPPGVTIIYGKETDQRVAILPPRTPHENHRAG